MLPALVLAFQLPLAWPAEAWSAAQNLTSIEGPGTNDFHDDLSGAHWNALTRRLWVCRNGPSGTTSKIWVLREDGAGSFVVDTRAGQRGEWTSFGDLEALTQVDLASDHVFTMIEAAEVIREYDLSVYGTATLLRTWDTSPVLPVSGGFGSEGLAFVPDAVLAAQGFVDAGGAPRISTRGMGGLMFVAHQNGGRVYAFDLSPTSSAFDFVGAYLTGASETAELCFDRPSGHLYALHGENVNEIEVLSLASTVVGTERKLVAVATYAPPSGMPATTNLEGLALVSSADCASGDRSLFLTIDDGGPTSLVRFRQFPCCETAPASQSVCAGDGTLALACPCANTGASGNGCANSRAVAGARLDACRTSTAAQIELLSSGTPPNSLVFFVASTTLASGGLQLGDGVHCIGGALLRLRAHTAVNGVALLGPSAGDPTLATLSSATPGSTFYYQAFYRDVNPTFCSSATMNATNAQRVDW